MGYVAALFVGISMGLIGAGGSILTIPILVYLFSVYPTLAISYSLFIVGVTSFVGFYNNFRQRLVNFKVAFVFGAASVTTVFLTRRFIIPQVPEVFFTIGSFRVTHALFVMVVFGLLMLVASVSMIRDAPLPDAKTIDSRKPELFILFGILIGLVTGFLGAGGGFLLIPALVLIMKLPMKEAIGTSLLVIALNSLTGFAGDLGHHTMEWPFLLSVTMIAVSGIFIGGRINRKIDGRKLKKGFGWFILVMGIFIVAKEILL